MSGLWWILPLLVTLVTVGAAWWFTRGDSFAASVQLLILLPVALIVSMAAWIVGGVCK